MPEKPIHPKYTELMQKAEDTLDEAVELLSQGPSHAEYAAAYIKAAETYRDFSAMFRGQGF